MIPECSCALRSTSTQINVGRGGIVLNRTPLHTFIAVGEAKLESTRDRDTCDQRINEQRVSQNYANERIVLYPYSLCERHQFLLSLKSRPHMFLERFVGRAAFWTRRASISWPMTPTWSPQGTIRRCCRAKPRDSHQSVLHIV